jgi:hypothetical protein
MDEETEAVPVALRREIPAVLRKSGALQRLSLAGTGETRAARISRQQWIAFFAKLHDERVKPRRKRL